MVFIMRHLGIERTAQVTQLCMWKKEDTSKQLYQEQIKSTARLCLPSLLFYSAIKQVVFCTCIAHLIRSFNLVPIASDFYCSIIVIVHFFSDFYVESTFSRSYSHSKDVVHSEMLISVA